MLCTLFFILLKKLNKKYSLFDRIKKSGFLWGLKVVLVWLIFSLLSIKASSQERQLTFGVWRNKARIGTISVDENIYKDQTVYLVQSEIKFRMVIGFNIVATEKTVFENGILTYSSLYRKINDKEKVNKSLSYSNGIYRIKYGNTIKALKLDTLRHNLVNLYLIQPNFIKKVYCDNHQSVSEVVKLAEGKYKVTMADGSYNIFYYRNGACIKVEVNNPMFCVQLIPLK